MHECRCRGAKQDPRSTTTQKGKSPRLINLSLKLCHRADNDIVKSSPHMTDKYIDNASSKEGYHYLSTGPRGENGSSPEGECVCLHEQT